MSNGVRRHSGVPTMGGGDSTHLTRRVSGLYVPKDAVERTLLEDDWRKLRRLFRLAKAQKMVAAFFCTECRQPIAGSHEDRLIAGKDGKALGGRIVLRCQCTAWRVK